MSLLVQILRGHRRAIAIILVLSVIEAAPAVSMGQFLAQALNHGFLVRRPGTGFRWLAALLGAMVLGAVATRLIYPRLSTVVEPMRDALVGKVVDASLRAPGHRSAGADAAAIARLTEQVEAVRRLVSALLRTFRQFGMAVIGTIIGVTVLSPILAVFVAPPVCIALVVFGLLLPRLAGRQRAVVLADEAVARDATGLLHGLRDVLACHAADRAAADMAAVIDQQARAARELARVSSVRVLIVAFGVQLPLVVLLALGPRLIHSGQLSAGALVAAAGYLTVTLEPALRSLVQVAGSWVLQLSVVLSRLREVVNSAPALNESPGGLGASARWECSGLTFAYGPHADPVLRDLDLTVAEGEHLAIVGPSGAGKSTLADLMCGLIRPQRGEIRIGGVPIDDWDRAALHDLVALIPQEAYVFAGTVAANVGYLNPAADLSAAAAAVGLGDLLDRLGGWDAPVRRTWLAAGEQQLIALARAYASTARLVILDEASCHLDQRHEALVERAFRERGGSLVVIAHRIASARRADRILVLDGVTAVSGRHEDLLVSSALYAQLAGHWEPATTTPRAVG